MDRVGVNVYCWGQTSQNLVLVECLEPAARDLGASLGPVRFWFDRVDTRGPHVTALYSGPRGSAGAITARLSAGLAGFFAAHPERDVTTLEEAERRHDSCRGWALSDVDREPGLAAEGTFRCFRHSADGYPFRLTRGLGDEAAEAAWGLLDDLSRWAVRQLAPDPARPPLRAALRWAAAFGHRLAELHPEAEGYWRFHASTLLFGLPRRLAEDERQVLAALPVAIGERNERVFSEVWRETAAAPPPWHGLPDLLRHVVPAAASPAAEPWRLTREIVHWTLKQLCFYAASEIPLVLYGWHRSLLAAASPAGART